MRMNERAMREYVQRLVRDTIAARGLPERPQLAEVVSALGLAQPVVGLLPAGQDGARVDRQIIISRRLTCPERIEFTGFHEVTHILLDEDGEIPSTLHDHFYRSPEEERTRALEELCHVGAAEFIMPAPAFAGFLREEEWRIAAIEGAAGIFRCSVVAAAFQYAHLQPDPCTVLVCEYGIPPRPAVPALQLEAEKPKPCLFVAYTARNEGSYPMCRYAPIPKHHLVHQVWHEGGTAEGQDTGFFKKPNPWRIVCEAACIGGRACAAYYPRGRRRPSRQPTLFE